MRGGFQFGPGVQQRVPAEAEVCSGYGQLVSLVGGRGRLGF
jgi:hypothetical protein